VLIHAVIDDVAPEIPVETSRFGSVTETENNADAEAPQEPERRSRTHDSVEFRCEHVGRPEPPCIGQQVETGAEDVPGRLQPCAKCRTTAQFVPVIPRGPARPDVVGEIHDATALPGVDDAMHSGAVL